MPVKTQKNKTLKKQTNTAGKRGKKRRHTSASQLKKTMRRKKSMKKQKKVVKLLSSPNDFPLVSPVINRKMKYSGGGIHTTMNNFLPSIATDMYYGLTSSLQNGFNAAVGNENRMASSNVNDQPIGTQTTQFAPSTGISSALATIKTSDL